MIFMIASLRNNEDKIIGFRFLDTKTKRTKDIYYVETVMAINVGTMRVENLKIEKSDLKGVNGAIDRYPKIIPGKGLVGKSPLVILAKTSTGTFICSDYKGSMAELDNDRVVRYVYDYDNGLANGKLVNYKVCAIEGNYKIVRKPIINKIIDSTEFKIKAYNKKCKKEGIKPFTFRVDGSTIILIDAYEWREKYDIPNFVTEIDNWAFSDNWVEHVEIPSSVIRIGDGAFENCKELRTVKIPSSIYEIGDDVFKGCSKLEYIKIPRHFRDKIGKIYNCKIETY